MSTINDANYSLSGFAANAQTKVLDLVDAGKRFAAKSLNIASNGFSRVQHAIQKNDQRILLAYTVVNVANSYFEKYVSNKFFAFVDEKVKKKNDEIEIVNQNLVNLEGDESDLKKYVVISPLQRAVGYGLISAITAFVVNSLFSRVTKTSLSSQTLAILSFGHAIISFTFKLNDPKNIVAKRPKLVKQVNGPTKEELLEQRIKTLESNDFKYVENRKNWSEKCNALTEKCEALILQVSRLNENQKKLEETIKNLQNNNFQQMPNLQNYPTKQEQAELLNKLTESNTQLIDSVRLNINNEIKELKELVESTLKDYPTLQKTKSMIEEFYDNPSEESEESQNDGSPTEKQNSNLNEEIKNPLNEQNQEIDKDLVEIKIDSNFVEKEEPKKEDKNNELLTN